MTGFLLTAAACFAVIAVLDSFVQSYGFQKTLGVSRPFIGFKKVERLGLASIAPLYARKMKAADNIPFVPSNGEDDDTSNVPKASSKRTKKALPSISDIVDMATAKEGLKDSTTSKASAKQTGKEAKPKLTKAKTSPAPAKSKSSRKLFPSTSDGTEEDDESLSSLLAEFAEDKEMYDSLEPDLVSIEEKLSRIGETMGAGAGGKGGGKRVRDNMKGGASGPPDDFEDEFDLRFDEKEMAELLKGFDDVKSTKGKRKEAIVDEKVDPEALFGDLDEEGGGFVLDDLNLMDLEDLDLDLEAEPGTLGEGLGINKDLNGKEGVITGADKKKKAQRGRGVRNYDDDMLDGLDGVGGGVQGSVEKLTNLLTEDAAVEPAIATDAEDKEEEGIEDKYNDEMELRKKRRFATYSLTGKNKRGGKKNTTADPLLNSLEEFQRLVTIMETQGGGLDNIEGVLAGGSEAAGKGSSKGKGKSKELDEENDGIFTFDRTSSYGAGSMYIGDEGGEVEGGGTLQDLVRRVDEEVEEKGGGNQYVDLKQLRKSGEFQDAIGQVWNPILQYYRGGHPDVEQAKHMSLHSINASVYRYIWENTTRADEIVSEIVADNLLIKDNMTIGHAGTQAAMARQHSNIRIGAPDFSKNYSEPSSSANASGAPAKAKGKYSHLPSWSTNEVYEYIQEPRKEVVHVTTFVYLENAYNKTLLNCAREMMAHVKGHISKEGWGHRVVFTLMCANSGGSERLAKGENVTINLDDFGKEEDSEPPAILEFEDWMESKGLKVSIIVKNKEERDLLLKAKEDYKSYLDSLPPETWKAHEQRRMERWEKWYAYRKAKEEEAKNEEMKMALTMGVQGRFRKTKKIFNPYPKDNIQMWVEGVNVKHLIDGAMIRELWGHIPYHLILGQKSLDSLVEQIHMTLFEETGGDMGNGQGHSVSNQHLRLRIEGGSLAMKKAFNTQNLRKEVKALIHG